MKRILIPCMAALLTVCLLHASPAFAQCVPGAPCLLPDYAPGDGNNDPKAGESAACDGDFMNQIYARAHLEAERENILNRFSIKKPDSVLEYSCFDSFLNHVAENAPPLFSESTEWANATVPLNIAHTAAGNDFQVMMNTFMETGHIISRLNQLVSQPLAQFVNTNFNHDTLGGTAGDDIVMSSSTSPGSYTCGNMSRIWEIAKCQNFPSPEDTFWTFEELIGGDPRTLIEACSGADNNIDRPKINVALNAAPDFDTALVDPLETNFDLVRPASDTAGCADPILTGLTVISYDVTTGGAVTATNLSGRTRTRNTDPERVCINPGCYFNGTRCIRG